MKNLQRIRFVDSVSTGPECFKNRQIYEVPKETADYMMKYGFAVPEISVVEEIAEKPVKKIKGKE